MQTNKHAYNQKEKNTVYIKKIKVNPHKHTKKTPRNVKKIRGSENSNLGQYTQEQVCIKFGALITM